ncbi:MAG: TIGR03790 family protein [Opitutus sp.]|nr:TIGR03790 family protein [Opitutus sp.]
MRFPRRFRTLLLGLCLLAPLLRAASEADRVIVLANSKDPGSLQIARHYVKQRGVPPANLVSLPLSTHESISWTEFVETLWSPLLERLVADAWIDAIPMSAHDDMGRRKYAISGHRIAYLVICRGVPLRINHDAKFVGPAGSKLNASFRVNNASVDSELALLPQSPYSTTGYVSNPLFRRDQPSRLELAKIVRVTRLDGPTVESAIGLIDRAIEAERTGLVGRAYVDIGGVHPDGDRWLEAAVKQIEQLRFDLTVDRAKSTFALGARFDAPVLYLGWYAASLNGPFQLPQFRFPTGAIAVHIHSYSASTVRSPGSNWVGPLVARGVTATVGNVFEPYLQLSHRPDLLLKSLARGDTFGQAATYSAPVLSWQTVAIGDPLYRPFAKSFAEQWREREQLPSSRAAYLVVRRMIELEQSGRAADALALARQVQKDTPSLVVALALAERLHRAGDTEGVARALGFVPLLTRVEPAEGALVARAAELLAQNGRSDLAFETFDRLLALDVPRALRSAWMRQARQTASDAADVKRTAQWTEVEDAPAKSEK